MKEISLNSKDKFKESKLPDPRSDMARLLSNRKKVWDLIKTCNIKVTYNG